jgi:hypothetical protein
VGWSRCVGLARSGRERRRVGHGSGRRGSGRRGGLSHRGLRHGSLRHRSLRHGSLRHRGGRGGRRGRRRGRRGHGSRGRIERIALGAEAARELEDIHLEAARGHRQRAVRRVERQDGRDEVLAVDRRAHLGVLGVRRQRGREQEAEPRVVGAALERVEHQETSQRRVRRALLAARAGLGSSNASEGEGSGGVGELHCCGCAGGVGLQAVRQIEE